MQKALEKCETPIQMSEVEYLKAKNKWVNTVIMQQVSVFAKIYKDITASTGLGKETCYKLKIYNHVQLL